MSHRFFIADVFTGRAFGGNQLAVFPEAEDIDDALMQAMAREINFSETTFVQPSRLPGHTHRVRIFTPASELPFAGHPTVGTAAVLTAMGQAEISDGMAELVFEEGVGTVRVKVETGAERLFARFTLETEPEIRPLGLDPATLAAMLGLPESRLVPDGAWAASVGGPVFCCIPLIDREAVSEARLDIQRWEVALPSSSWAREIYVIAGDFAPGGRLKVRMWAPGVGVTEDPATGSAAATLAASLASALPNRDGVFRWTIEQGAEIGRPSLIEAEAEKRNGKVALVRVGGSTVLVGEGRMPLAGAML